MSNIAKALMFAGLALVSIIAIFLIVVVLFIVPV